MLSRGVNMPLIRIKMIIKKKPVNIYCCCVPEKVEIKRASPRAATIKTAEQKKRRAMLPSKGMLKAILNPGSYSQPGSTRRCSNTFLISKIFTEANPVKLKSALSWWGLFVLSGGYQR